MPTLLQNKMLKVLSEKIIPWAKSDARLVLVQPPVLAGPETSVLSYPAEPLQTGQKERSHVMLHLWPAEELNAMRVPYLGCVFEGEADLKTGVTDEMVTEGATDYADCARQVLTLPAGTFFCVPAGVPISGAGSRGHWERPNPEKSHSRIFWMHILPAGIICHTCTSRGHEHVTHPYFFVRDWQIMPMMEFLIEELRSREWHYEAVAGSHLLTLLLRVERALHTTESIIANTNDQGNRGIMAQRCGAAVR